METIAGILALIKAGSSLIDKFVPDPNARAAAKEELQKAIMEKAGDIVVAESSGNWMQRSWRPLLMFMLMAEIVWLGAIAPILGVADVTIQALKGVPAEFYHLLMIGMGGYIGGRSIEKVTGKLAPVIGALKQALPADKTNASSY